MNVQGETCGCRKREQSQGIQAGEVFEYLWAVAWSYSRARFVRLLVFLFHRIHVLVGIMQYLIGTSRFAGLGCMAYR